MAARVFFCISGCGRNRPGDYHISTVAMPISMMRQAMMMEIFSSRDINTSVQRLLDFAHRRRRHLGISRDIPGQLIVGRHRAGSNMRCRFEQPRRGQEQREAEPRADHDFDRAPHHHSFSFGVGIAKPRLTFVCLKPSNCAAVFTQLGAFLKSTVTLALGFTTRSFHRSLKLWLSDSSRPSVCCGNGNGLAGATRGGP
jgi:hypothetical protein